MVKSVLGVNHQGLTEWKIQRLTALFMAVYSIFFIGYLVFHPGMLFIEWRALFAHLSMKIASILFLLAILYHAWIGMWTVYTDYINNFIIRAMVEVLTLLLFAACFIWGLMILWSV